MTVLDAACLVALFRGEPGADAVGELIRAGAVLSAINRAETIDRLVRQGAGATDVRADLDVLELESPPVTTELADRAGVLRAPHYHRTTSALSLADCVALATAIDLDRPLATSDHALARVAWALGLDVCAIANSHGDAPTQGD